MPNKETVIVDGNGYVTREPYYPVRYSSVAEIKAALERALEAHHLYEQYSGVPDKDWATWYANYMYQEQVKEN